MPGRLDSKLLLRTPDAKGKTTQGRLVLSGDNNTCFTHIQRDFVGVVLAIFGAVTIVGAGKSSDIRVGL